MPPVPTPYLTPSEKRIMDVLWRRGASSIRDVQAALKGVADLNYNTVLSTLRTMTDKGYVAYRKDGRAFVYEAAITEARARDQALSAMISRFFGGSTRAFAQHLVSASELEGEDLDALLEAIRETEAVQRNG